MRYYQNTCLVDYCDKRIAFCCSLYYPLLSYSFSSLLCLQLMMAVVKYQDHVKMKKRMGNARLDQRQLQVVITVVKY
ncbi:hypothetical protein K492DRAFT_58334 [Lichtheimia hyalospora FSU 10163]|nr:hypothetical protein K492DRAFT_58334 [Lichtheimia hyalospora FSU 10163]